VTETQRSAPEFIANQPKGQTCGYTLKRNLVGNTGTLKRLASRKLVEPIGLGHMAFPANAMYRITAKGRAALEGKA